MQIKNHLATGAFSSFRKVSVAHCISLYCVTLLRISNLYARGRDHVIPLQPAILEQDKGIAEHRDALQRLSNGRPLAYAETLRCVKCEGSKAPAQSPPVTRKPPVRLPPQMHGSNTQS